MRQLVDDIAELDAGIEVKQAEKHEAELRLRRARRRLASVAGN